MSQKTLTGILEDVSSLKNRGITFVEHSSSESFLSYQELYQFSLKGLSLLQKSGLKPKDELVFQVEDNKAFIILFWSCVLGGIIPVPLSIGKNDDQKAKLFNVWSILDNPYLASTPEQLDKISKYGLSNSQSHLSTRIRGKSINFEELYASADPGVIHQSKPTDLAFVQFSSGSTGSPKGVMLTHENLITNVAAIGSAAGYSASDSTLSWMPLTHDMGLIGFHINPIFSRMNQYLMPTGVFVRNPTLWLSKATQHGTTVLCSPNFGYKYLLKHLDESTNYSWDLSAVRIIYNGAEPISEDLGQTFLNTLAKYGLQRNAMCPVYGLAEASLAVSMSRMEEEVISVALDRNQLNIGDRVSLTTSENALSFVNVGKAVNDVFINITDEDGQEVEEEVIGKVKIKGRNVTSAYYNNLEITNQTISNDGWLDTGDLGFIKEEALYITGRAKDIFFVNGQNFYPHDLERIAEGVEGIELNKVIISGTAGTGVQSEEVIAFVFHRGKLDLFIPISQALKSHVNAQTGVEIARVIPVRDIPKTTSGKLQRFKLVERYKSGDYSQILKEIVSLQKTHNEVDSADVQPETETEKGLTEIWKKLFNRQEISMTERFFEIGGNSLKGAEFGMAVLKRFEVDLPLTALYSNQSIPEIASILDSSDETKYLPILKSLEVGHHEVSPLQRRLFYFQETNKTSTAYNVPVAFEALSNIDIDLLKTCIRKLIGRYDVLRSSFFQEGERAFMKIHSDIDFQLNLPKADFSDSGIIASLITPFDLTEPGLFRVFLIQRDAGKSVLLFDFHHIIMDGVSISLLIEELIQLYQVGQLEQPAAQYSDFLRWSQNHQKSENLATRRQYWVNELKGELPLLEMPLDQPRPRQFVHKGEKVEFAIGKVKSGKLRAFSKKHGCSMHTLMFAFYNILLHKYTGQKEFIIGIPVTVRNHPDVNRTMGMFVNNLPIRVQINPKESFEVLLGKLMDLIGNALLNDYPFDFMLDDIEVQRDLSRNPLFDTMFLYQNMDLPESGDKALQLNPLFINPKVSKFDISQEVFDNGSAPLTYSFEYATSLFNPETIQRLADHFDTLLDRVLINPLTKIADISLLSVKEYEQQVFDFNDTRQKYPDQSVLDVIDVRTSESPDSTAIVYNKEKISFKELSRRSASVAKMLKAGGVKKGDVVAVFLDRSPELISGILGIMKAGGTYLPVDISLPQKRVSYLLSHSQCKWVIAKEIYKAELSESIDLGARAFAIDQLALIAEQEEIKHEIDPSNLAYLLYTSGTTGKPKGVKVSHKALHNYSSWAATEYVGDTSGSFPLFTSISFDLTLTSIFTPLVTGNAIVIYNEEAHDHEHAVVRAVRDNRVDIIKLTPSHLRLLRDIDLSDLGEIRLQKMIVGGESFDAALAREINEKFKGKLEIFNEYGPTEATVGCMIHQFDPKDLSLTVPVGVPAANTEIYLLDEHLHPVPTGIKGEIYIAGSGLASGYLFDQALTAETFIPNPFVENERMYKTGDLAKRLDNGVLEYLGRVDEQIKVNGYRIEPDEINYYLRQYPDVTDSVVEVRNLEDRENLFAYLLTEKGTAAIEESPLKTYLAERLPFYMIPTRIICLEEFPITGNGKIDHRTLAALAIEKEGEPKKEASNEVERIFADIWQDLLAKEYVAVDDNFFELGGDSIKAVQIVSRLHEKGISVQVKDILTYHTIEHLVSNEKYSYSGLSADQGIISGVKDRSPIESWFFNQEFANPSYYNQSVLLNINEVLNVSLLQKAFETLIGHHDGLRLNYDRNSKVLFFNERHLNQDFIIPVRALEEDFTGQLVKIKSEFDISESLLIKAVIFSDKDEQKYLFLTAHHLVTDGLSWRILLHDLSQTYKSLETGSQKALPPKTTSLIEWQHQLSAWQPEMGEVSKQYWEQVKQCPFVLPLDFKTNDWSVKGLRQYTVSLDKDYTDFLIREAHKPYRTHVFTLLNVALAWAIRDWTGSNTFVLEHENHGRHLDDCDVSRTLGWFTAMYPVKLELVGKDPREQIKAIKEQIKKVPHHGIPFGLDSQRSVQGKSESPSELRLNYLGEFVLEDNDHWSFSGLPTGPETASDNHLTAKLELNAIVMNEVFSLDIAYHETAFLDQTIHDFGANFTRNLIALLDQIRDESDVHFTPSDFEIALDQKELDELFM